jgi:segregation and condensation protein B
MKNSSEGTSVTPMSEELMDKEELFEPVESLGREESRQVLYALLFVSDRPVSAVRLSEALGDMDSEIVAALLEELREELNARNEIPYELHEIAGGYQLVTKPQFAPYIRRLFQVKKSNRLSKALLETLAVIAYKQPVTRAEVEAIRGVSVSYAFEQLQEKRLIKISGIAELPGRPKLYKTTDEFLVSFGLKSLKELPSLDELRTLD